MIRCALILVVASAVAQVPNRPSVEKEVALGRQIAAEIDRTAAEVSGPEIVDYVNRLAIALAQQASLPAPLTVRVLRSSESRGGALPGGFLYIASSLIAVTENEAALAGVVAHLIAHVAARHGLVTNTATGDLASIPLIFMGGCTRFNDTLMPLSFVATAANFEREADRLAISYLAASGYDPLPMIDLFSKLRPKGTLAAQMSSPAGLDQLRAYFADNFPRSVNYVVTTSEFTRIRARVISEAGEKSPRPPSLYRTRREFPH